MSELFVTYISYGMVALLIVYVHRIIYFSRGLSRLSPGDSKNQYDVCVIIPARNEEKSISECINSVINQNYPKDKLSVIVVDDQSTDKTVESVEIIATASQIPISIVRVFDFIEIKSPKIRALAHGIQHTPAPILLTTDADCIAPVDWVSSLVSYFEPNVGVVTGLTIYNKPKDISSLFWGVQYLDFLSYTSIGAGAIGMGKALVSNGSNLAIRREAFDDSGGFDSLIHINSGDDSLLAQKIVSGGKWRAQFAFQPSATIVTAPAKNWKEFLQQRLRWVGQTAFYPGYMMFFMICTFILFTLLPIVLFLTLFSWNNIPWIILAGKFSIDYYMMNKFTRLTATQAAMKYFIPTAVIHIPYILITTIGGYFFTFEWKGRTLKKETTQ